MVWEYLKALLPRVILTQLPCVDVDICQIVADFIERRSHKALLDSRGVQRHSRAFRAPGLARRFVNYTKATCQGRDGVEKVGRATGESKAADRFKRDPGRWYDGVVVAGAVARSGVMRTYGTSRTWRETAQPWKVRGASARRMQRLVAARCSYRQLDTFLQ